MERIIFEGDEEERVFCLKSRSARKFEVERMESRMTNNSSAPFDALVNSYPLLVKIRALQVNEKRYRKG